MDMDGYQITVKAPDGNAITMSAEQFEVWQKENNPPEKEMEFSKDEYRQQRVCTTLYRKYDFVRVRALANIDQDIYYREKPNEFTGETTYHKLEDKTAERIVRDEYLRIYHMAPGKKVKDAVLTLRVNVMKEVDAINDKLIEVAPSLFWDMEAMTLTDQPPAPCFRQLFDSGGSDEIAVDATRMSTSMIRTYYNVTLNHLKQNDGFIVPDNDLFDIENKHLKPFWTWADQDPEVYNDLLKAAASVFMKNKPKGSFILIGPTRNGKSNLSNSTPVLAKVVNTSASNNTPVYSEIKWVSHGDLKPGDEVLSWRGRFKKIVATVKHPAGKFYRLTLQDGRTIEAGEDHLWSVVPKTRLAGHHPRVRDAHGRPTNKRYSIPIERYDPDMWEIMSTKELLKDYRAPDKISKEGWVKKQCKYYIPPAQPVALPDQSYPIDPYVLGIIIGDAHITEKGAVRISGMDPELIETVTNRPAYIEEKKTAKSKAGTINYGGTTAAYKDKLVKLGLVHKRSYEKFIPGQYLIGSIEQRYALLRGLMDTDATISHAKSNSDINQVEFSTASKQLADQVRSLVFSLGGSATIHERMGKYRLPDGTYKNTRPNYRLFIRTLENPFRLPRKASCWRPQKWLGYTAITNIEYIGEQEAQCIAIDGDEHTYLATENYIPTHNTFIKMLHIMLGRNNTSAVKLADFNEPRLNMTLSTSFLNAPDEEDEGRKNDLLQSQGLFKSVAAHESVQLKVYFSQKPQWVSTKFMCFFPMNHYPEWSGTGAAACMKRSLILPFRADLSKFDNTGKDFVEETFTASFYEALVGVLLGIAKYYETHTFELSDKAKEMKKKVNDEVDNITTYINRLMVWFNGYKSTNLVYEDYKIWCDQNSIKWQYKNVFSDRLNMISHEGRYTPNWDSGSFKVQRFDDTRGRNIFYEDFPVEQFGGKKICDFINGNGDNTDCKSVIFELDQLLERKKAQEVTGDE